MTPLQILNSYPKRVRESTQGYFLRVLHFASLHYITGTLDRAVMIMERAKLGATPAEENALSNAILDLREERKMVEELYRLYKEDGL